ncbi:MAG: hypothetical protein VR72_01635 [Clostridiaceae bacterium BRH_c20a]|nr:MAG: hypothetical protein VR72_03185 [Clostridiaceae bacterium BRH_c20a]KJS23360.1 MAG: hypothetical protein VR72_01635 [Clostridiaceae bacterium BRH_c20a]
MSGNITKSPVPIYVILTETPALDGEPLSPWLTDKGSHPLRGGVCRQISLPWGPLPIKGKMNGLCTILKS